MPSFTNNPVKYFCLLVLAYKLGKGEKFFLNFGTNSYLRNLNIFSIINPVYNARNAQGVCMTNKYV